ncbi:MAG TPA: Gfo/Idh/MocA family oxidoreductase [Chloroflexota bacterium]|nr:Gfo/Idh/MocA family oxidoreductase [Chloroflexota bacterium]
MDTNPTRVGIIGCGNISGIYLKNAQRFEGITVAACADLDLARAQAKAAEFGVPRACTVEELLADPTIELVVNLTIPRAHASVGHAVLAAGKSLYTEKPLTLTREEGRALLDRARERSLRVGGAPDTFLGAGWQTGRKLIDEGAIGVPVAAIAHMLCHGHEGWHPDPAFYYQPGGGPLFDMGPYYLTALVSLLGPVHYVNGMARASFPERTITSLPRRGERITVAVPTHTAAVLQFASGAIATLVTSFDVWKSDAPRLEIHGSEGSLSLPDPNGFDGAVRLHRAGEAGWSDIPLIPGYRGNSRGIGVADLAEAIRDGRPPRASGDLAYHVLDVMQAIHETAADGQRRTIESTCERPAPLVGGSAEVQEEGDLAPRSATSVPRENTTADHAERIKRAREDGQAGRAVTVTSEELERIAAVPDDEMARTIEQ